MSTPYITKNFPMFWSAFPTPYLTNVIDAIVSWFRSNPTMEGTAVWLQMEDILDSARRERARREPGEWAYTFKLSGRDLL